MVQTFRFCDTCIAVEAPRFIKERSEDAQFRCSNEKPDFTIICEETDRILPDSTSLGSTDNQKICRNGDTVYRYSEAGDHIYAEIAYSLGGNSARLRICEDDWDWVVRNLHFWVAAAFPSLMLCCRALLFHASYIDWNGTGILFTAPSQTGKSTQAELWRRCRGAKVINGDKAAVRSDGTPAVYGVPFSGTSGICENHTCPLGAVVVLSQAPVNKARRLRPSEAASALLPNLFADHAVSEEWSMALNLLLDLIEKVPVYSLACTPDLYAVEELERILQEEGSICFEPSI